MNTSTYVFDFDRTLFDDDILIASLMRMFISYGATEEGLLNAYAKIAVQGEIWSPWKWAEYTFGNISADINAGISGLHKRASEMVYKDTQPFLDYIANNKKIILSYGDTRTQREKIDYSGLAHYFSDIVITQDGKKTSEFERFSKKENVIFIDDRGPIIDAVKSAHPDVICIRIMRTGSAYNHEQSLRADRVITSLDDLNGER